MKPTPKELIIIAEHGQPSAYLQDVGDYELMIDRMKTLEGITKGEQAFRECRTIDMAQAKEKMNKWLK
jgi:PHD/YefM family antitoxin component YafN of YafNO toxin-antitoxin module